MKKLILCCDGTANEFGNSKTNVCKLYQILDKKQQFTYYDPGVGTYSGINVYSKIAKNYFRILGLGLGFGLKDNVSQAYNFLMENYEEGDEIFLFGFSRGAYTVRVLAGMLHLCGLLEKGNGHHTPYAYRLYTQPKLNFGLLGEFKKTFSTRKVQIKFMGIWDSVSSVGSIGNFRNYPYTKRLDNVKMVKHALAIDEKRTFYTQNEIRNISKADVEEVWFAGVHSDIGGSFPDTENGLGKITFKWLVDHAIKEGLFVDQSRYEDIISERKDNKGPDPYDKLHSNGYAWRLLEFIPRKNVQYEDGKKQVSWYLPFNRPRKIPKDATIHESVALRKEKMNYNPAHLL
jgi:uncharacterized protein (DUF2235 family)